MARLNDYAAPAESVDALKRRFVRQNREIMRVNSMQSMRIRSLESEVSHLLSENVSLRGQIITLTQENERLEHGKALQNGIYEIKARLDAKLAELNSLVSDLGQLPRKASKMSKSKDNLKSFDSDRPKTEAPPRMNDPDYNAEEEEGKLPAILEDKYFPRRTLDPQEIHNLDDDSCLPESPKMHHFGSEDEADGDLHPEPQDAIFRPEKTLSAHSSDPASPNPEAYLPPTLETRKKKKRPDVTAAIRDTTATATTTAPTDVEAHQTSPVKPSPSPSSTSIKFGSKRKFSLDDDILADLAPEEDDFQFSRLSRSPQKDPFKFMTESEPESPSKTPQIKRGSTSTTTTKRKVLEPKSANSNLSPKKARPSQPLKPTQNENILAKSQSHSKLSKDKDLAPDGKSPPRRPRGRPPSILQKPKRATQPQPQPQHSLMENAPKLSMKMTRDSMAKDSPTKSENLSDENGAVRPSRRRGAVVSYAEPNLRAKMRRPTGDMADAVTGRRSSSFLGRDSLEGEDGGGFETVTTRRNPEDGPEDTDEGDEEEDVKATVSRRRRKLSSFKTVDDDEMDVKPAPTKTTSKSKQSLGQVSSRSSRRHSSNPKASTSIDLDDWSQSQVDSSFEDELWKGESRRETRRRSMMV